jgi:hypothetical protein
MTKKNKIDTKALQEKENVEARKYLDTLDPLHRERTIAKAIEVLSESDDPIAKDILLGLKKGVLDS